MPELARERTDFAEDRTRSSPTSARSRSWLRTGFGGIRNRARLPRICSRQDPAEWLPRAIASAFLVIAIIIFVAAERRASTVIHRLHTHQVETVKIGILRLITFVTVAATLALIAGALAFHAVIVTTGSIDRAWRRLTGSSIATRSNFAPMMQAGAPSDGAQWITRPSDNSASWPPIARHRVPRSAFAPARTALVIW